MNETPGANIEDASGLMRVMEEMSPRRSHLRRLGKLSGISGSSCPSQPTTPASRSVTGTSSGLSISFLDRDVSLVAMRESLLDVVP